MPRVEPKRPGVWLRLYVAGNAPNSLRAISNIKALCAEHLASQPELEIVDMMAHPRRALADGVIVTPTLLRVRPLPFHRVVGNLDDAKQVLLLLGVE